MRIKYLFRQRKIVSLVSSFLILFLAILFIFFQARIARGVDLEVTSDSPPLNGGPHTYDNVTIQARGVLTHDANNGLAGFDLVVTNELKIEAGGQIDVSAKGYPGGSVQCALYKPLNAYLFRINPAQGRDPGQGGQSGNAGFGFNWAGRGGNWSIGGTGGGGAYITLNRGGAGGGAGGAYGYGSGAKTSIPTRGIGNYGGGGGGWEGDGGAGASSANGENGSNCFDGEAPEFCTPYTNQRLFGGGGGAGTPNFPSAPAAGWCPEYSISEMPEGLFDQSTMDEAFYGGAGGGAAKIKAKKMVIESGGLISAAGRSGNAPYYLSERDGLGAGGGGGTIYIEVNDLEISGTAAAVISAEGAGGWALIWGSDYSISGAGGGGIIYIKVNSSVKIDNVYYDSSTNWKGRLTTKLSALGGLNPNVNNPEASGGPGQIILEGNPQIPSAQCDRNNIKFKETKFVSGIPDKVDQGQELAVDLKYTLSNDQPAECTEKFYLHFSLPADWTLVSSNLDGFGSATPGGGITSRYYWNLGQISQSGDRTYNPSFVAKAPTSTCPAANQFLIWQSYGTGPDTSFKTSDMVYSKNFSVNCPGFTVTGDVGAVGNVEGITVLGNSVVTRAGGTYSAGSGVTDLAGYTHSIDFSQIEARFAALKQERAKPFSAIVGGQLNPDNKPEGGVWTLTSGALSGNYTGSATIFRDGNLTIDNLRVTGGVLGIVVSGGAVDIKDNQLNNVAIYAYGSNAKIVFKNSLNSASIYGAFIAQSIDIEPQATGNVSYDADLVKYPPPPGFSQILSQIQLLEAVP